MDIILNQSDFYIVNHTADGTIVRISEKMAGFLGITRAGAEGKNYYDLVDADQVPALKEADQRLIEGKSDTQCFQVAIGSKNGTEKLLLTSGRFVLDDKKEDSPTIYLVGADMSDVGVGEDQAFEKANEMQRLAALIGTGYWSVDPEGVSIHWSREIF